MRVLIINSVYGVGSTDEVCDSQSCGFVTTK